LWRLGEVKDLVTVATDAGFASADADVVGRVAVLAATMAGNVVRLRLRAMTLGAAWRVIVVAGVASRAISMCSGPLGHAGSLSGVAWSASLRALARGVVRRVASRAAMRVRHFSIGHARVTGAARSNTRRRVSIVATLAVLVG
jgi:hypothetical protein